MFDFHMHSTVSFDACDAPEKMVQAAISAGLKEICFTDHIDEDPRGIITNQVFTVEAYNAAYDHLHSDKVKIRRGMEFGLLNDNRESFKQYLAQRHYDFVLGSIHYAGDYDPYLPEFWVGKAVEQAEKLYFEEMLRAVRLHDDYDVLGHLTYISKTQCNPAPRVLPLAEYRDIVVEIMKVLIAKGKGIEVNTSGVDRVGDFLPGEEYLRLFKELGGEIVTVGSDAHAVNRVGQYTDRACQMLKEIFGYVCTFEDRKPIFHKL